MHTREEYNNNAKNIITNIMNHTEREILAFRNLGNDNVVLNSIFSCLEEIVPTILDKTYEHFSKNSDHIENYVEFLEWIMSSSVVLFIGDLLSDLTGNDFEWQEIPIDDVIDKTLSIPFEDKTFTLEINSIEYNMRYPMVMRYNHDNKYAHIHDGLHGFNIFTLEAEEFKNVPKDDTPYNRIATRFITFPFKPHELYMSSEASVETIQNSLYAVNIKDGSVELFPGVPLCFLEENGIDIKERYESEYITFKDEFFDSDEDLEDDDSIENIKESQAYQYAKGIIEDFLFEHGGENSNIQIEEIQEYLKGFNYDLNEESIQMVLEDIASSEDSENND